MNKDKIDFILGELENDIISNYRKNVWYHFHYELIKNFLGNVNALDDFEECMLSYEFPDIPFKNTFKGLDYERNVMYSLVLSYIVCRSYCSSDSSLNNQLDLMVHFIQNIGVNDKIVRLLSNLLSTCDNSDKFYSNAMCEIESIPADGLSYSVVVGLSSIISLRLIREGRFNIIKPYSMKIGALILDNIFKAEHILSLLKEKFG